jgi:hypothetical protein
MVNPFERKAGFSWKILAIAGGNPEGFAATVQAAGIETVYVKVADGPKRYKVLRGVLYIENVTQELVDALRAVGLNVVGWGFLYGKDPMGEAHIAVEQVNRFALDGYVFDVEGQFDAQPGAVANAYSIMRTFKAGCPNIPTAFCWWYMWHKANQPGVVWHPPQVAKAWMDLADYGLSMCYWGGSTPANALWYLNESHKQWREITQKPLIMAGRAYTGDGGTATPEAIAAFAGRVRELKCAGIAWWSLDSAYANASIWAALAKTPGWIPVGVTPPPVTLTLEQRVARLEQHLGLV